MAKFKMAAHAKINDPMLSLLLVLGSLTQKTSENQNQVYEFAIPIYGKNQFRSECRGGHLKNQGGCIH